MNDFAKKVILYSAAGALLTGCGTKIKTEDHNLGITMPQIPIEDASSSDPNKNGRKWTEVTNRSKLPINMTEHVISSTGVQTNETVQDGYLDPEARQNIVNGFNDAYASNDNGLIKTQLTFLDGPYMALGIPKDRCIEQVIGLKKGTQKDTGKFTYEIQINGRMNDKCIDKKLTGESSYNPVTDIYQIGENFFKALGTGVASGTASGSVEAGAVSFFARFIGGNVESTNNNFDLRDVLSEYGAMEVKAATIEGNYDSEKPYEMQLMTEDGFEKAAEMAWPGTDRYSGKNNEMIRVQSPFGDATYFLDDKVDFKSGKMDKFGNYTLNISVPTDSSVYSAFWGTVSEALTAIAIGKVATETTEYLIKTEYVQVEVETTKTPTKAPPLNPPGPSL